MGLIGLGEGFNPDKIKKQLHEKIIKLQPVTGNTIVPSEVKLLSYSNISKKLSTKLANRCVAFLNSRKVITFSVPIVVKNLVQIEKQCGE